MASGGNSYRCVVGEVTKTRQDKNQFYDNETRSAAETGNYKRKNPFGSLLSLAWKLWEAEQKKSKLAGGRSAENSFSRADVFRTRSNVAGLYNQSTYAPFQIPTNVGSSNFRPPAMLPTPVTANVYRDFENSVPRSVRQYADDYTRCTSYSPDVARSNNVAVPFAAQSDDNAAKQPRILAYWGNCTAFENDDSAPEEEELHLSERRRHQCHMCSYQTDNRSHMLRHQATAHDACKLYHCYICKVDFSRSERAKSHFLSIHPEIPYHSKIIRKRQHDADGQPTPMMGSKSSAREHIVAKVHVPTETPTGSASGRKSWEKYCRLVPPSGSSGCYFRCIRCAHVGPDIWHLKRHFLSSHSGMHAYSCRVCRYSTGDVQRLIGHMTGHGELFCHQCSFSTVELERFKDHLCTCTGEGPMDSGDSQCPVCGDHFEDNSVVKQHVLEVHQRDYCEHCACVIYGPETIEDHLLQHQTDQNTTAGAAASHDNQRMSEDAGDIFGTSGRRDPSDTSKDALETTEEGVHQSKYRFGRFSNQTYYCPVEGCPFKATWKKSIELHTLNYHTDVTVDDHTESVAVVQSSSPDLASATAPVAISGLFNCPFCPNCRTFKYRKSYEKHLLQHGVDYVKHPYLVVRSSQRDEPVAQNSSMSVL